MGFGISALGHFGSSVEISFSSRPPYYGTFGIHLLPITTCSTYLTNQGAAVCYPLCLARSFAAPVLLLPRCCCGCRAAAGPAGLPPLRGPTAVAPSLALPLGRFGRMHNAVVSASACFEVLSSKLTCRWIVMNWFLVMFAPMPKCHSWHFKEQCSSVEAP